MGCDIHLFEEIRKNGQWETADQWTKNEYYESDDDDSSEPEFEIKRENRFYSRRNYNLFCALCGVRSYGFTGELKMVHEEKGIPEDLCKEILYEINGYGSDGHSHSWNTLKELKEFDWSAYGDTCKDFLDTVIPKMEAQNVGDEDVRIVYFFDN